MLVPMRSSIFTFLGCCSGTNAQILIRKTDVALDMLPGGIEVPNRRGKTLTMQHSVNSGLPIIGYGREGKVSHGLPTS